jgi:hypothetical protein
MAENGVTKPVCAPRAPFSLLHARGKGRAEKTGHMQALRHARGRIPNPNPSPRGPGTGTPRKAPGVRSLRRRPLPPRSYRRGASRHPCTACTAVSTERATSATPCCRIRPCPRCMSGCPRSARRARQAEAGGLSRASRPDHRHRDEGLQARAGRKTGLRVPSDGRIQIAGAPLQRPARVARGRGTRPRPVVPRPLGVSIVLSASRSSCIEEGERRMHVVEAFRYRDAGNHSTRTRKAAVR